MHRWSFAAVGWLLIPVALAPVSVGQSARVEAVGGKVIVTRTGGRELPAVPGLALVVRDALGTDMGARATLRLNESWFARIGENTDVVINAAMLGAKSREQLRIQLGSAFLYSREEEGMFKEVVTPSATGGMRGTQALVRVARDGKTFLQVIEGEVNLTNTHGSVVLRAGEAGEAEIGQAPRRTAVIETRNLVQWALYYPAVLPAEEISLAADERAALGDSLAAYRQGDLLAALERFPAGLTMASPGGRLYHAAVLLATGQVDAAQAALQSVPADDRGRRAIERMIAAVLEREQPAAGQPTTAGEALAESYYQQSRRRLEAARSAARRATELAPDSGFTWTRLAELEFSFGRVREATAALEKGLRLAPRHAQAHALRGYLLSADYRIAEARGAFEEALRLDGALGNAWLGLGLTKFRQGAREEGRADLQLAATTEPTRSFFYSYHGKTWSALGVGELALKDLALARQLDPADPTPWLYSAIEHERQYRFGAGVEDLARSLRLNDNRRIYRAQFLLDQDRAVRRANLAAIYRNAGLAEVAERESTRAVEDDYTNPSAHLFLANSLDARRDPRRLTLRYETAWFNELLLSHLLAPVGGGPLSQQVSQQEYSRLLDADGAGGSVVTEWRERGGLDQRVAVFGTRGRVSAGLDFAYFKDPGEWTNGATLRRELHAQVKWQATPDDVLYALGKAQTQENGDILPNYDNRPRSLAVRYEEKQDPGLLLLGWNHRWAPGVHTLVLGGRLAARENFTDAGTSQLLLERNPLFLQPGFLRPAATGNRLEFTAPVLRNAAGPPLANPGGGALVASADFRREIAPYLGRAPVTGAFTEPFDFATRRTFELLTAEVQQLWQTRKHTAILGGRAQGGEFEARARLDLANPMLAPIFMAPAAAQAVAADFRRAGVYAYDFFRAAPGLSLLAGAAWDRIERPENFRAPPLSPGEVTVEKTSGKLGFTFAPGPELTVRGVYAESLGGVSFDESVRLEPVQLAGFNQAFRTVISEAVAGSVETPRYKNLGVSAAGEWASRTWWSASFNRLEERVARTVGVFDAFTVNDPIFPAGTVMLPASTPQRLDYREDVLAADVSQFVGREFALGAGFRETRAQLRTVWPQIPVAVNRVGERWERAVLRELAFTATWNSPTGLFARAEIVRLTQTSDAALGGLRVTMPPGDAFAHVNAWAGIRLHRNRHELGVGGLNLTDREYHLTSLTWKRELPQRRTFVVRARLNF